ncbi:hypothetical protein [Deinococcus yavapaiensis]|uniref:Uncharacterized protein n=1 Tax=Deinococcus yavapaiensis KR-236 TaxID=694435 RepID=A0A318SBK1_9DEIO|nr:hypothetical protein [Deinococcus yavapaiensis]PYE48110.1 hypothetical protein DES52_13316 [Deinococcus yavapaiensis KR-236]
MHASTRRSHLTPNRSPARWRHALYTFAALLTVAVMQLFMGSFTVALEPFGVKLGVFEPGVPRFVDAWYQAQWAVLSAILPCGALLASLRRPTERPLLIQFFALVVSLVALTFVVVPGPEDTANIGLELLIAAGIPLGLALSTYPAPRALLRRPWRAPVHLPTLVASAVMALALLPITLREAHLQATTRDYLAQHLTHASAVTLALLLTAGGLLSAFGTPGARVIRILVGLSLLYLGLCAFATVERAGSWGAPGGAAALLGGLVFLTLPAWSGRRVGSNAARDRHDEGH